jgi:hypothetical protein
MGMFGEMKSSSMTGPVLSGAEQEFDEQGRGYWNCPGMNVQEAGESKDADAHVHEVRYESTKAEANLVSSKCKDGKHRPVIDFDVPVRYVPSTTPGHGHLYIDIPMEWPVYANLLIALRAAGVVEEGYLNAALQRGATYVRPEWVKKPYKVLKDNEDLKPDDVCLWKV